MKEEIRRKRNSHHRAANSSLKMEGQASGRKLRLPFFLDYLRSFVFVSVISFATDVDLKSNSGIKLPRVKAIDTKILIYKCFTSSSSKRKNLSGVNTKHICF